MAFAQIYISRDCLESSFPYLEEAVQPCVGDVIYGSRYPDPAEVSASAAHGTLRRFLELDVRVDTEDLPAIGWLITETGLCVPDTSTLNEEVILGEIPEEGLTEKQLYKHHKNQSRLITAAIEESAIWSGLFGWRGQLPENLKAGVLVVKAQGAWHATDSDPED